MSSPWSSPDPSNPYQGWTPQSGGPNEQASQGAPYGAQPGASGYSAANQWGWGQSKPGIIPLRPLTIGDLFNGSFAALRANPKVLFGFTFAVMAVVALITAIASYLPTLTFQSLTGSSDPQSLSRHSTEAQAIAIMTSLASSGVQTLATLAGTAILTGVLAATVSQLMIGNTLTIGQAWAMTRSRLGALIGTTILSGIIAVLPVICWVAVSIALIAAMFYSPAIGFSIFGVILGFFPVLALTVYLVTKLQFSPICAVLEEKGPIQSLKRSWSLTRGEFWSTLVRMFLMSLVTSTVVTILSGVVGIIVSLVVFAIGSSEDSSVVLAVSSGLAVLAASLVTPLTSTFTTLVYADLRMCKENFAVVLAQASAQQG